MKWANGVEVALLMLMPNCQRTSLFLAGYFQNWGFFWEWFLEGNNGIKVRNDNKIYIHIKFEKIIYLNLHE